jgi:hypothetical protein
MRYVLSVLLVGTLLVGPSLTFAQVETEVSEVTGVKRIESASMNPLHDETYAGSHASFRAEYVNDPDEGTSWILSFYGFTEKETEVSRTNQFVVQADGQQFEPTRLESKTRQVDGSLIEIKRATFPRPTFELIANAQMVNISIGGAQFSAIKPRREDMRLILERVPDSNTPQTASNDSSESR